MRAISDWLRDRFSWRSIFLYLCAIVVFVYFFLPPTWMIITSFMTEKEAMSIPPHFYPHEPTLSHYIALLLPKRASLLEATVGARAIENLLPSFRNSATVAIGVMLLNLIFGSLAAYASARLNFRGNAFLLFLYMATRMAPPIVLLLPMYLIILRVGLVDNPLSLILAYASITLPFTIWMLRSYFQTIPRELEDAARVDRCNWANMMVRVFLPVAAPGLVAAGIFSFLSSWSEFLYAVIFSKTVASKTLPIIVAEFSSDIWTDRTLAMAAGVVAVVPPLMIALIFQRLIMRGLVAGAVKG